MRNKILLLFVLGIFYTKAQVGINTTTPNSTLTVEGSFETAYSEKNSNYTISSNDHYLSYNGLSSGTFTLPAVGSVSTSFTGRIYRIKNVSQYTLTLKANGIDKIRNGTSPDTNSFDLPAGYYAELVNNSNNAGNTTWDLSYVGYPNIPSTYWQFDNIYDYQATNYQDLTAAQSGTNLTGFTKTINVPANRSAKIIISYSIPIGAQRGNEEGYYGVTLFKGAVEFPGGSRKFTQFKSPGTAAYSMATVSASVADNIPSSASAQSITYSLKAYLESTIGTNRFLMYDTGANPNFNWGRGYWSLTVYLK